MTFQICHFDRKGEISVFSSSIFLAYARNDDINLLVLLRCEWDALCGFVIVKKGLNAKCEFTRFPFGKND